MITFLELLKKYALSIAVILVYLVSSNLLFGSICPSRVLIGLPCAACGMTRAGFSMLALDFKSALYYNPMIFLAVPLIALYAGFKIWCPKLVRKLFYPALFILILSHIVFAYRIQNHWGREPFLVNSNSIIHKIINYVVDK